MSDTRINGYLSSGTNAERLAFTPDPAVPAAAPDAATLWYETDTGDTYAWTVATGWEIVGGAGSGDLLSTNNLSDVASPSTSRANLGLAIGTNVQAYDADLTTWAGITPGANVGTFLATPSSANLAAAVTDETGSGALVFGTDPDLTGADITPAAAPSTNAIGYLGSPISAALDSGNVAPAIADCGKTFYHTDANARNFTIPANASVAFPIGSILGIEQGPSAAAVTVIITTDTLQWGSSTGSRTLAANGGCSIQKVSATVWRIRGEGIT